MQTDITKCLPVDGVDYVILICDQGMNRVVTDLTHVQRVCRLYKFILRLHRSLPPEMRSLGDDYVRSEFKRHKDAEKQFVPVFMQEWTVTDRDFVCYFMLSK